MTLSCWRLIIFCHHSSLRWYWHPQYPSQFARCKHPTSSRWRKLPHSHSVWTLLIKRGWTHCLPPPPLPRVQVNITCTSIAKRVRLQSLQDSTARHKSFNQLHLSQLRTQQSPKHNHRYQPRTFHLGLMKWPQQNSLQTVIHHKLLFPTGHILVGSVDHDHDRNHWFTHRQSCPHLTHSARRYPHHGTARLSHLWGHNNLSLSHPPTTDPRQLTIT